MRFRNLIISLICLFIMVGGIEVEASELSSVNTLSSITIDGKEITGFDSNKTSYDIAFDSDKISITIGASRTDSSSTLSGDIGVKNLNYGLNTFKITVQSETQVAKVYTLKVTRKASVSQGEEEEKSSVNTLKSLTLSEGEIAFKPEVTTYEVTLQNQIEKVEIKSELTDSKAKYITGFGNRTVSLKTGLNKLEIRVQAENGDIRIYVINVTRKEALNVEPEKPNDSNNEVSPLPESKSSVNTLKSLTLSEGEIAFKPEVTTYEVTLQNQIEKVEIKSELTDSKAKYVSGFGNRTVKLEPGANEVLIKVEAQNGEVNTYTLKIIREEEDLLSSTKIKSLEIRNHTIAFDNAITDYKLNVQEQEKELDIAISLVNDKASYEILNNENLEDNDTVIIRVTSEDGTKTKDFKIKISKEKSIQNIPIETTTNDDDFFQKSLYLGVGIFLLGIIFLVIALLYKRKVETH